MLTLVLYGLLAVLVAVGLFLLAAWLLPSGEQIAPVIRDEPLWRLPAEQRLDVDAVAAVTLPVALRGYRFAETDLLLDRLGEELRERDVEIAQLRARLAEADERVAEVPEAVTEALEATDEPVAERADEQAADEPADEPTDEPTDEPVDEPQPAAAERRDAR